MTTTCPNTYHITYLPTVFQVTIYEIKKIQESFFPNDIYKSLKQNNPK